MVHSLRGRLILMGFVNLVGMLAVGGMAVYAVRGGLTQLKDVDSQVVTPLSHLHALERHIKEVRYRMAGVALGQLPTVGSVNHLKEMMQVIPVAWSDFVGTANVQAMPEELRTELDKIRAGIKGLDGLMARLLSAYQADDLAQVKGILEDDWPLVHSQVIKPMEQFVPYYQRVVQEAFTRTQQQAEKLTIGVFTLLILCLGGVWGVNLYLLRHLNNQIKRAKEAVKAVASFDLTYPIAVEGRDEISAVLRELATMQANLRNIVSKLKENAKSLEAMSSDLASISSQVASASQLEAESATRMASAVEELSVSIDHMREQAAESDRLVTQSGEATRQGMEIIQSTTLEMVAIAEGARQSAAIVAELGGLSNEISSIVNVIREIADQTNLLALNAAIEAARAGEQGRGFAVVADEVRKLAERTAGSTQQIVDMIERIQSGTRRAVEAMEANVGRAGQGEELARRAGESIEQIERLTREVVHAVNEIEHALSEQSAVARDVAEQVERIAQMTESNAQASTQISQHASKVLGNAKHLNESASSFRV